MYLVALQFKYTGILFRTLVHANETYKKGGHVDLRKWHRPLAMAGIKDADQALEAKLKAD